MTSCVLGDSWFLGPSEHATEDSHQHPQACERHADLTPPVWNRITREGTEQPLKRLRLVSGLKVLVRAGIAAIAVGLAPKQPTAPPGSSLVELFKDAPEPCFHGDDAAA